MRSDFPKADAEGSDIIMERRTGTPVEKWDDVNGRNSAPSGIADMVHYGNVMPMITNDMSQGERFIQLRESTGMNRKEFADYLGIPYRTMSDWERDIRTMPDYVFALIEYKVTAEFGLKLPQELDPNTIGNVRRGLEDQLEQNDNNLDGVINNVVNVIDDNANGIPDEDEKICGDQPASEKTTAPKLTVHDKAEKTSLLKELRDCIPEPSEHPHRALHPELVL